MSELAEKGPMPPGISPAPWRESALRIGTSGFFYEILDANGEPICGLKTRRDRGDAGANARLIANTPRLLGACKLALHYFENHADHGAFDVEEELTVLRAAIAEAEGRS